MCSTFNELDKINQGPSCNRVIERFKNNFKKLLVERIRNSKKLLKFTSIIKFI